MFGLALKGAATVYMMTNSITALGITTLSTLVFRIVILIWCCYTDCHFFTVVLGVDILNVIVLNVVMLCVVMLNVVARVQIPVLLIF